MQNEDRGKDIFGSKADPKYAEMFLKSLLIYIKDWGENFKKTSNGNVHIFSARLNGKFKLGKTSQFVVAYENLVKEKVKFPAPERRPAGGNQTTVEERKRGQSYSHSQDTRGRASTTRNQSSNPQTRGAKNLNSEVSAIVQESSDVLTFAKESLETDFVDTGIFLS